MATRRRGRIPNVFYGALLAVSTLFVVTALAYLTVPMIAQKAADDPAAIAENPATPRLAGWLDRHGPTALGVQFAAMVALGLAAMASDPWFEGGGDEPRGGGHG